MAAKHVFDAAATRPTPREIVAVAVDIFGVVINAGLVVHANATAGSVEEPVTARESDTPANCGEEVAVAAADVWSTSTVRARLLAAAVEVHVAALSFNSEDKPIPLEIVTDLAAGDDTRLIITPRLVVMPVFIKVLVLTVTE